MTAVPMTAQEEECLERFRNGDIEGFYEFWDMIGVDLRLRPGDRVIIPAHAS